MAQTTKSKLEQNREFFDRFFTVTIKNRFNEIFAKHQSDPKPMYIQIGACTQSRCHLTVNGHGLVFMAGDMASSVPKIYVEFCPPEGSSRPKFKIELEYHSQNGWFFKEGGQGKIGREGEAFLAWLDQTIDQFLEWVSDPKKDKSQK